MCIITPAPPVCVWYDHVLIFSFPRFFEMKTVFERIQDCGMEALRITNNSTVEEDLKEMAFEELKPVTSESERANCTPVYIPRINVTELRFDPYYSSVSYLLHFKCKMYKTLKKVWTKNLSKVSRLVPDSALQLWQPLFEVQPCFFYVLLYRFFRGPFWKISNVVPTTLLQIPFKKEGHIIHLALNGLFRFTKYHVVHNNMKSSYLRQLLTLCHNKKWICVIYIWEILYTVCRKENTIRQSK